MAVKRKILCVVGTRPEAIKMAPVIATLKGESWTNVRVVVTAQHRDLLDSAFAAFGITPDIDLDLMRANQSLSEITARAFAHLETAIKGEEPDMIVAQGDTTTVMVAAVTAFYLKIPFAHVEAGLRTGDVRNPFPEEINRVFASKVTDLHFAPTRQSADALLAEGTPTEKIFLTGNTVIDALLATRDKATAPPLDIPANDKLILMTAHRRENFGAPLEGAFAAVRQIVDARPGVHVLYPVHPNPNVRAAAERILGDHERIHLRAPLNYGDFVAAMNAADIVLTDSGGVQEEAPALGKPVLVMRDETERPEAVSFGVVKLVGTDPETIGVELARLLEDPAAYAAMARGLSPYGDGRAAQRIVQAIADFFGESPAMERLGDFVVA